MPIKKILIVDDSPTERFALIEFLSKQGFSVVTADNGEEGVIKAKADLGQGNTIEVIGTINDKDQKILLDGYCKFDATKLTKK